MEKATVAALNEEPQLEGVGSVIGPYRLLEEIGHGGMGAVYLAQQREPIRRKVALKIIKLGMDTRQVVARFEVERQALAMMEHPNIARVLDAGATASGRPYFVMELVRGVPITRFCDESRLEIPARLKIFMDVCGAIQHAHQKGIIHRDIKPSNILVTLHGEVAVPKVIDFGVAKATESLTDKTLFTGYQQFVGTPAYMSPEQASLSGLDIDTRSDVYSLGVLLYELLTGGLPFTVDVNSAGFDALRREVMEVDPPTPSVRMRTLTTAQRTTLAQLRQMDPKRLGAVLSGDLDWVVMKALEKDRGRRYESPAALAKDVEHYLRCEPVTAVAPTLRYRAVRFVQRNRRMTAMATVVLGAILAGGAVSGTQAYRALRAEQEAYREARKSAQVGALLRDMLEGVAPAQAMGADTKLLLKILQRTSERVGRDLAEQPEVEVELRMTMGRVFEALGDFTNAAAMQERALVLAEKTLPAGRSTVAALSADLGLTRHELGNRESAEALLQRAIALSESGGAGETAVLGLAMQRLGALRIDQGRIDDAERWITNAIAIQSRVLGPEHAATLQSESKLGWMYFELGRFEEIPAMMTRVVEVHRRVLGVEHPNMFKALTLLGLTEMQLGEFAKAERSIDEMVRIKRRVLGEDHFDTLASQDNLAVLYGKQGRYAEAETLARSVMTAFSKKLGLRHSYTCSSMSNLAELLRNQGRFLEAERLFLEAMAAQREDLEATDLGRLETALGYAVLCEWQGKLGEAETVLRTQLAALKASADAAEPLTGGSVAEYWDRLSHVLILAKRFGEAEEAARECLRLRRGMSRDQWARPAAEVLIGLALEGQGKSTAACEFLRSGLMELRRLERRIPYVERPRLGEGRSAWKRVCGAGAAGSEAELDVWVLPVGSQTWPKEIRNSQTSESR